MHKIVSVSLVLIFSLIEIQAQFVKTPSLIYQGTDSEMTLMFQMDRPQIAVIRYGKTKEYEIGAVQISQHEQGPNENVFSYKIHYLQAGTTYYYKISDKKNNYVFESQFKAGQSSTDTSLYFNVISNSDFDTRETDLISEIILADLEKQPEHSSFVLHTGNLAKKAANEAELQEAYFDTTARNFTKLKSQMPVFCTKGYSDDLKKAKSSKPKNLFRKYFYYPFPSENADCYSVDYGGLTLFVLDQTAGFDPDSSQYKHLEDVLKANSGRRTVILVNSALSAKGKKKKYAADFMVNITVLLDKYKVDLVIFEDHKKDYAEKVSLTNYVSVGKNEFLSVEISGQTTTVLRKKSDGTLIEQSVFDLEEKK